MKLNYGNINTLNFKKSKNTIKSLKNLIELENILKDNLYNKFFGVEGGLLVYINRLRENYINNLMGNKIKLNHYRWGNGSDMHFSPAYPKDPPIALKELDLSFFVSYISVPHWYGSLLLLIALRLKKNNILELGTCFGISSIYLLAAIEQRGKGFFETVDKWDLAQKYSHDIFENFNEANYKLINGDTKNVLPELIKKKKKYDLVFMDASHWGEQVFKEGEMIFKSMAPGGIMIIDDINLGKEMKKAWKKLAKMKEVVYYAVWGNARIGIILKA